MRICYMGDAGSVHTQRWVEWFARRHDVDVISTSGHPGLERYLVATLPVRTLRGTRLARSLARVRRVLRERRPDVLHSHYINEAGWLGAASGWRPLVITAWGSDVYRAPDESRCARYFNPLALRRANWVTCDSLDQADVIRSWGVDRVSVIGWGVDRAEFHLGLDGSAVRESLDIPPDAAVVYSPRDWYRNSNIPVLVAAHSRLPGDVYLVLKRYSACHGDDVAAIERAVAVSPARSRIRVVGSIPAHQLPKLYAAADVVISLCTTDGTPVSLLEAMASGLPVVAFHNPSVAEWITPPGGVLVSRLDPQLIASSAKKLLLPEARCRAATHNAAVVERRADRDAQFARMDDVYNELLHRSVRRTSS